MQEEQQGLLKHSTVRSRFTSWLFSVNFSHSFVRNITMSITFVAYSTILIAFFMMKETIQRGELPWYTIDVIIVAVSFLLAIVAPVIAWGGWRRRRTTMMAWLMPTAVAAFAFFAVPSSTPSNGTELCELGASLPPPSNSAAVARLVLLIIMCLFVSLTLTAISCHSIGYMAEHNLEGLMWNFGILVMARTVGFVFFSKVLSEVPPYIQVALVCVTLVIHLIQLLKVPETAPQAEGNLAPSLDSRGMLSSIGRVVSNKAAMTLIFAMGFSAAALWGFGYNENDIIKVKYLQTYRPGFLSIHAEALYYHVVLLVIWFVAVKYSPKLMPSFARGPMLKLAAILAAIAVPVYVAAGLLYCTQGAVAGLSAASYIQPNCSSQCTCDSTKNIFAPICVVEQVTTYLSPCHAGCAESQTADGLKYMSGCMCASAAGRALDGACSAGSCQNAFQYHKILMLILIILTVLILQVVGVLVVRAADARDRAVALGVMTSVISFVVFVAGHPVFFAIGANTCLWFEAGSCQLHSSMFSYLIGGAAAAFALIAAIICIVAVYFFSEKNEEQTDLAM